MISATNSHPEQQRNDIDAHKLNNNLCVELQVHTYNGERSLIYAPGLGSWQQNSEIIHATSTDPEGPYKYRDTVLGHFSHGPTVRKYDDKPTYMMMNLGCGRPFMPFVHGCTNGSTPSNILSSINGHIPHAANESTRSDADERSCQSCPNPLS